jgi:cation transport ATPase
MGARTAATQASRGKPAGAPAPAFLRPGKTLPLFTPSPPAPVPAPPPARGPLASRSRPTGERVSLAVEGMHCASCVSTIERALSEVPGVTEASVNLGTARAQVRGENLDPRRLVAAVQASGYGARPAEEASPDEDARRAAREIRALGRRTAASAALTLPVLAISMSMVVFPGRNLLLLVLTLPVYLWAGWPFLSGMARTLQHRTANMDTLVGLGTTAALLLSAAATFFPSRFSAAGAAGHVYYEAVGVIVTLILLGRWLETRARGRTSAAVRKLLDLAPKNARLIRKGAEIEIPV